jgi:hypothetical protein
MLFSHRTEEMEGPGSSLKTHKNINPMSESGVFCLISCARSHLSINPVALGFKFQHEFLVEHT